MNIVDKGLPILVIGFQRVDPLEEILASCLRETSSIIYVSIDGGTPESELRVSETRRLIEQMSDLNPGRIKFRFFTKNFGSAVNVISSLDWFFSENEFGVVFEDDCIPHPDFFAFAMHALQFIAKDPDIWFFSGYRPQIKALEFPIYGLSQLPLNWGWGTTATKWKEVRGLLLLQESENLILNFFRGASAVYWNIGFRRSLLGWVDTWDTAIAYLMFKNCKFTLIPNVNLIRNVGNDSFASNTKKESTFLNSQVSDWDKSVITICANETGNINRGLNKEMIGIKWRHVLTPIVRFQMQRLVKSHKSLGKLAHRLDEFSNQQGRMQSGAE
jgi:hypothetical protein